MDVAFFEKIFYIDDIKRNLASTPSAYLPNSPIISIFTVSALLVFDHKFILPNSH